MSARTNLRNKAIAITGAAALVAIGLPAAMASAATDAETDARGNCSSTSRWDLDVEREDGGRYEVSFEVDSDVQGQQWKIKLSQNGEGFFNRTRTTDFEGEADVDRKRPNTAGTDAFIAKATNKATGETCSAKVSRS